VATRVWPVTAKTMAGEVQDYKQQKHENGYCPEHLHPARCVSRRFAIGCHINSSNSCSATLHLEGM
jgi:hypothetical protein